MPYEASTVAFARPVPYLLVRGLGQRLAAPLRYGSGGALVAPTSGTVTIRRPGGTDLVTAAAVTIGSSIAYYDLAAPAATESIGSGWDVLWDFSIGGNTYPTFRITAYLCEFVPPNVISEADLYVRIPELRQRVPQAQGDRGDKTGWQPQIDEAYYELIRRLLDDGHQPWMIREVHGYREWLQIRALQLCVQTVSYGPETSWSDHARNLYHEMKRAEARFRIQYADDGSGTRRARGPIINLAAVGRPKW